eukprot:tig00021127_g18701.t1
MLKWKRRLETLGSVHAFDYHYLAGGKRGAPAPMPKLVQQHREELERVANASPGGIVLIGKSMGSRASCHLSAELEGHLRQRVRCVIALGYPLKGANGKLRDEVLQSVQHPTLFVQGTRDAMSPMEKLREAVEKMRGRGVPAEVLAVEQGDHSLVVSKRELKARGTTQEDADAAVLQRIASFVQAHCS